MPLDDLRVCVYAADTEDVCIVERLFSSSLVAIVSLKAPRKLKVCHFKKGTEICNYSYSNTILAVKLNRQVRRTPRRSVMDSASQSSVSDGSPLSPSPFLSPTEADCVSGGVTLHSQYPRHESAAHYQRNSAEPVR